MLEEGGRYAVMLYTWRSCSRAVPSVRSICVVSSHLAPKSGLTPNRLAPKPEVEKTTVQCIFLLSFNPLVPKGSPVTSKIV